MKGFKKFAALFLILVFISGCAHPLTMENISLYRAGFINSGLTNSSIGLNAVTSTPEEERLVLAVANSLKKEGFRVIYPYYQNNNNSQGVDYSIKINAGSEFKGSGANFFVNFPGFLIFAPALLGYSYNVNFDFNIDVVDNKNNTNIPRITVPIKLRIKHADINRTWTEISWLEVGGIAFISGLFFMGYDKSVTPLMMDNAENKLGDYVSSKISATLVGVNASTKNSQQAAINTKQNIVLDKN